MKCRKISDRNSGLLYEHMSEIPIKNNSDPMEVLLKPAFIKSQWADWKTVIIICTDNWAITGLRHLLARCGGIRLRVLNCIPEPDLWGNPDAVIWMRERFDSLTELTGEVLRLRRLHRDVRQLIISDFLPPGLTRLCRSPVNGIILVRANDKIELLQSKIAELLYSLDEMSTLLAEHLSPGQWRVIFQMARGADTREIAAKNGVSIKTVLAQRSQSMVRLGLSNLSELAFVLRSVQQMQNVVPAISKTIKNTRRECKL